MSRGILHLGYGHSDTDVRIMKKECTDLAKILNYEVTYITSNKNAIKDKDYTSNGVNIKIISLVNRRFVRLFLYLRDIKKYIIKNAETIDLCHIHEFPMWFLIPFLKRKKIKIIIDMHENDVYDYSKHIKRKHGRFIGGFVEKLLYVFEKKCVKSSNAIISVSPQLIRRLEKYEKPVTMISNFPILPEHMKEKTYEEFLLNIKSLCFAGGIDKTWSHDKIIDILDTFDDVHYNLAGKSSETYINFLKGKNAWDKVNYLGHIPFEKVQEIYDNSSIGMCVIRKDILSEDMRESGTLGITKFFEFMLNGIPMVFTNFSMWCDIANKYNCGLPVDPYNNEEIKRAIAFFIENPIIAYEMGKGGIKAIKEEFNWQVESKKLLSVYKSIFDE